MDNARIKRTALDALTGIWGTAIIAGIIASIFLSDRIGPEIHSNFKEYRKFDGDIARLTKELFIGSLGVIFYITITVGLIFFILRGAIRLGYCQFNMDIVGYREPQLGTIFSKFNIFGQAFLLELLTSLIVFLGFLLLIIPGIIAAYCFAMAPYIMAENPDISATEALSRSIKMMNGHKLDLFFLHLSFIGWAILCIFTCGIGFLWLYPYFCASEAAFYLEIKGE